MNIFKLFRHAEKSTEIEEIKNIEVEQLKNENQEVEEKEPSIELKQIAELMNVTFQPYLETLTEMKMMLEKVRTIEQETIEQSEKLNDTINNRVIEALASRGIHQLEEQESEICMSARDRLAKDYKENPSKFLNNFNQ